MLHTHRTLTCIILMMRLGTLTQGNFSRQLINQDVNCCNSWKKSSVIGEEDNALVDTNNLSAFRSGVFSFYLEWVCLFPSVDSVDVENWNFLPIHWRTCFTIPIRYTCDRGVKKCMFSLITLYSVVKLFVNLSSSLLMMPTNSALQNYAESTST